MIVTFFLLFGLTFPINTHIYTLALSGLEGNSSQLHQRSATALNSEQSHTGMKRDENAAGNRNK